MSSRLAENSLTLQDRRAMAPPMGATIEQPGIDARIRKMSSAIHSKPMRDETIRLAGLHTWFHSLHLALATGRLDRAEALANTPKAKGSGIERTAERARLRATHKT